MFHRKFFLLFFLSLCIWVFAPLSVSVFWNTAGTDVIITELQYNPSASEAEWEWIELYNPTSWALSMSGWTLEEDGGPSYTFASGASIASWDYFLLVNDTTEFQSMFSSVTPDVDMDGAWCYSTSECLRLNKSSFDSLSLKNERWGEVDLVCWEFGG